MNRMSPTRIFFAVALLLAGLAVAEKVANMLGYHLTFLGAVLPSQLGEWAAIVVLFVIALELREIKHMRSGMGG